MCTAVLLLACLACAAQAIGVHSITEGAQSSSYAGHQDSTREVELKPLSLLLLSLNHAAAFKPSSHGAYLSRPATACGNSHAVLSPTEGARSLPMQEDVSNYVAEVSQNAYGAVGQHSRVGIPAMFMKNPFKDKMDGATTVILTVGFRIGDRGPQSVLGQLDTLANSADTSSAEGIADLCKDTALMLLRRSDEWISTAGSAKHDGNDDVALADFDRQIIKEAAKFDERDRSAASDPAKAKDTLSTLGVVSIVACVMGNREEEIQTSFSGGVSPMKTALQELATISSDAEQVFGFELLWVPGDDTEVLDANEVMIDWPELMPC